MQMAEIVTKAITVFKELFCKSNFLIAKLVTRDVMNKDNQSMKNIFI